MEIEQLDKIFTCSYNIGDGYIDVCYIVDFGTAFGRGYITV